MAFRWCGSRVTESVDSRDDAVAETRRQLRRTAGGKLDQEQLVTAASGVKVAGKIWMRKKRCVFLVRLYKV